MNLKQIFKDILKAAAFPYYIDHHFIEEEKDSADAKESKTIKRQHS